MRIIEKTFKIQKLAEARDAVDSIASLLEEQWPTYYDDGGPGDAQAELNNGARLRGLPLVLCALDRSGKTVGTVALKDQSIPSHRHLSPWLAALIVRPECRRQGIADALVEAIEKEASLQGFSEIYSATHTAKGILERRGWLRIDEELEDGELFGIYIKKL